MEREAWAVSVAEKIKKKYPEIVRRNKGKIPYSAVNGTFDDLTNQSIGWWTNGFYGGMLWQLYHATGDQEYREAAQELEDKLDAVLMDYNSMDHDSGFRFLTTAVADFRITGKETSKNRGLLAAANLAGRFNPQGNFIRAWNDENGNNAGWAIIDCMMNLPLLYWASDITKDDRFYHVAVRHANTAMKYFIRENGSARHIVEFDSKSGDFIQDFGGQGYEKGSSWTRGQAWALYGFILSYIYTGDINYLDTARRVATYFISNIPDNGLIPVDFCQPADCTLEDSCASAIAASGLILLAQVLSGQKELAGGHKNPFTQTASEEAGKAENAAFKLLMALDENRCSWGSDRDELLEKCTAAFHDEKHEFPIIYGDYYFIEAIFRLTGEELFIW
ncbi:MAG: glycoside hydrolase family 88 protein [Lachnospiraceae bacterium]|nr:glycoside hydrolase family 88 protein [Lachnospiraceae bacterium]